jgi:cell division protein FtsL
MSDFEEFTRKFDIEPTVFRPLEQKTILQRMREVINQIRKCAIGLFVLFVIFMAFAMVLASLERMVYRKNLIDKDYIIEMENGVEKARRHGSR